MDAPDPFEDVDLADLAGWDHETQAMIQDLSLEGVEGNWVADGALHVMLEQPMPTAKISQGGRKSKEMLRIERMRARNRQAQARYRQKLKEASSEIEAKMHTTEELIRAARARLGQLKDQKSDLTQRATAASAALVATLNISRLLPVDLQGTPAAAPASPPPTVEAPVGAGGHARPPPLAPQASATSTMGVSTSVPHAGQALATRGGHSRTMFRSTAPVPPPLSAFRHHTSIRYDAVEASGVRGDAQKSLPTSAQCTMRRWLNHFRTASAAHMGSTVQDVAWFAQMRTNVSATAALSYSTTLSSQECVASFILYYLHISLEIALATHVMDEQQGQAAGGYLQEEPPLATAGELGGGGRLWGAEDDGRGFLKRRRGAPHAPSATGAVPSHAVYQSAEAMAAAVGLSGTCIDAMHVRCGVNQRVPLREAVTAMYRDTARRYITSVHQDVMQRKLAQVIETEEKMIKSFATGAQERKDNVAAAMAQAQQSRQEGPGAESGHAASDDAMLTWVQQYCQGCTEHIMGVVVVVRGELLSIMEDLPSMVIEATADEDLSLALQQPVQKHVAQMLVDFHMGEALAIQDSTKFVFNLMIDSLLPFIPYYEIDNMHVALYKSLKPTSEQATLMKDCWLQWERQKRRLDEDVHDIRQLLSTLPACVGLPAPFIAHVKWLAASGPFPTAEHVPATSTASRVSGAAGHRDAAGQGQQYVGPCVHVGSGGCSLHASSSSLQVAPHDQSFGMDSAVGVGPSLSDSSMQHALDLCFQPPLPAWSPAAATDGEARFLGQFPEEMESAEKALHQLQRVHGLERDMFIDVIDYRFPGVLLEIGQIMRLWTQHFLSQVVPPDFLSLCQLAANQQNRQSLFQRPFC